MVHRARAKETVRLFDKLKSLDTWDYDQAEESLKFFNQDLQRKVDQAEMRKQDRED